MLRESSIFGETWSEFFSASSVPLCLCGELFLAMSKHRDTETQRTQRKLLQNCGLGAEVEEMPTLKGVDGFTRHYTNVGCLQIKRFG